MRPWSSPAADEATRSALLLVLAARIPVAGGHLKVGGFALPMRTASVRSQVAVVRVAHSSDAVAEVRRACASKARVVVVDDLDAVFQSDARAAIARLIADARLDALERETTLTLIVSCAETSGADDIVPDGMVVHMSELSPYRSASYAAVGG